MGTTNAISTSQTSLNKQEISNTDRPVQLQKELKMGNTLEVQNSKKSSKKSKKKDSSKDSTLDTQESLKSQESTRHSNLVHKSSINSELTNVSTINPEPFHRHYPEVEK